MLIFYFPVIINSMICVVYQNKDKYSSLIYVNRLLQILLECNNTVKIKKYYLQIYN